MFMDSLSIGSLRSAVHSVCIHSEEIGGRVSNVIKPLDRWSAPNYGQTCQTCDHSTLIKTQADGQLSSTIPELWNLTVLLWF